MDELNLTSDALHNPSDDSTTASAAPLRPTHKPAHKRQRSLDAYVPQTGGGAPEQLAATYERLAHRAAVIEQLLNLKREAGRLPHGVGPAALQALELKDRKRLNDLLHHCAQYQADHPDEPLVNALVPLRRGRPEHSVLTAEQEQWLFAASLKTDYPAELPGVFVKPQTHRPPAQFLWHLLLERWPELRGHVHVRQVAYLLKKWTRKEPVLTKLAWQGTDAVEEAFGLKRNNDVAAPDVRHQSDARPLPIYVRSGNLVCTVTFLTVIDDYSRVMLGWLLFPRKQEAEPDEVPVNVDFTHQHVQALLASIWHTTGRRSRLFYTDNGGQYKALVRYMQLFAHDDRTLIEPIFSKPGKPRGRGKVEVVQKIIDSSLRGLFGFIPESDSTSAWRNMWREAHQHPERLLTFEECEQLVAAHVQQWNAAPRANEQPSRQAVYDSVPNQALPAPSGPRLAMLAYATSTVLASISDAGVRSKNKLYEPVTRDAEVDQRWLVAAARAQKVPLVSFTLPQQGEVTMVSLDGHTWERVQVKGTQRISAQQHIESRRGGIYREGSRLRSLLQQIDAEIEAAFGGTPRRHPVTNEVIRPPAVSMTQDDASTSTQPPAQPPPAPQHRRTRPVAAALPPATRAPSDPPLPQQRRPSTAPAAPGGSRGSGGRPAQAARRQGQPLPPPSTLIEPFTPASATADAEQPTLDLAQAGPLPVAKPTNAIERMRQLRAQREQDTER